MSERKMWWICATLACLIYGVSGFAIGQRRGRAEMKVWQDQWYAEHKPIPLSQVITVCKFDDHAPPKEGDWVTISMTVAGDCSVADGSPNQPIVGKVIRPPAPKPAPRKDASECQHLEQDANCVTLPYKTWSGAMAQLKADAKMMERAKESIEMLNKECVGGFVGNPPAKGEPLWKSEPSQWHSVEPGGSACFTQDEKGNITFGPCGESDRPAPQP